MRYQAFSQAQIPDMINIYHTTFRDAEGETEGKLIAEVAGALLNTTKPEDYTAYVALDDNKVIAAIIFSRLRFESNIKAFILAPVAVKTDYQGQGIGQQLIRYGLEQLKNNGTELVITYGDPNFYCKVGFQSVSTEDIPAPLPLSMPIGWLAQTLNDKELPTIAGKSSCVPALNRNDIW